MLGLGAPQSASHGAHRWVIYIAGIAAGASVQGCANTQATTTNAPIEFKSGERFAQPDASPTGFANADDSWDANYTATDTLVSTNIGLQAVEKGEPIVVQKGDTLFGISRRYRVSLDALIATNNAAPPYTIEIGETIYLPPANVHIVRDGETLRDISDRFNVDYRSLAVMNKLPKPYEVHPGDQVQLPVLARDFGAFNIAAAKAEPKPPPDTRTGGPMLESKQVATREPDRPTFADAVFEQPKPRAPIKPIKTTKASLKTKRGPVSAQGFSWPLQGQLLQGFGEQPGGLKNEGLNISAREGAPIYAAKDGQVVYAGADLSDFGNLLLIAHDNGWVTAYAHTSQMYVGMGEKVARGQPIAAVGETGAVGDPQLHFQIRKQKTPMDPKGLLP